MIKIKNLYKALKEQGPFKRVFRNFIITGNAWGMFHKNSHYRADTGQPKITYNTKQTAEKIAKIIENKNNVHYSIYKCIFCDGYHLGRNKFNKNGK